MTVLLVGQQSPARTDQLSQHPARSSRVISRLISRRRPGQRSDHSLGSTGGVPQAPSAVGTKREFGYNSIGRLTGDVVSTIGLGGAKTARSWQAYEYDNVGNVSAQTVGFPGSTANGKHVYGYDKAGRLTSWTNAAGTMTSYGYDGSGNRTLAGSSTFEFDARNQLTAEKQSAVTKATFAYTSRGTLKSEIRDGAITGSVVDGLGRVIQTGSVSYNYDGLDRVNARAEASSTVAFVFSGLGSDPVSDGTATYYRTPTGRPVALTRNGLTSWVAANRHGDATMLHTAATETNPVVGTQAFDPWGAPITPVVAPIGYQSNWTDPTSKQAWMNARWYQPKTGSFTSRDTILGPLGGPSAGHNRQTYANNNPMTFWDPTGRFMEGVCISCVAISLFGEIENAYDKNDPGLISHSTYAGLNGAFNFSPIKQFMDPFAPAVVERDGRSVMRVSLQVLVKAHFFGRDQALFGEMFDTAMSLYAHESARLGLNAVASTLNFQNWGGIQTAYAPKESFWGAFENCSKDFDDARYANQCVAESKKRSGLEEATALWMINYGLQNGSLRRATGTSSAGVYPASMVSENGALKSGFCPLSNITTVMLGSCLANYAVGPNVTQELTLYGQIISAANNASQGPGNATKPRVCPGNSFTADTHVLMADGTTKRIEDVAVGDIVLATDPETGKSGPHTVRALIIGEGEKRLIDIVVETNDGPRTIVATWNHDFWVDDQGQWLRADRLDRGDDLLSPNGERVTVVSTSERTAYRRVHNLTVAGVHSYYVLAGRQPVLVHNDGDEYPSPLPTQKQGKTQPLTNAQAKDLAEYNGYRDTGRTLRGEKIFTDGKNFIVQDTTSHNGGTWKIAKSERALGSKTTRTATTDALLEPIGC
jgi:RHS repeat-associated protein